MFCRQVYQVVFCSTMVAVAAGTARTAHGQGWIAPTPDELKMTSQPDAPDAKAVVLYRDELSDDDNHMRSRYMRIKILTESGKDLGDVRIGFDQRNDGDGSTVSDVAGRTIQPDGTIVPFTGKPYEKVVEKGNGYKLAYKVFSMPAVQVGSIIEYRYKQRWEDNRFRSPDWEIQSDLYLKKGHFLWKPTDRELLSTTRGGRENTTSALVWDKALPKGVDLKNTRLPNGRLLLEVNVENVAPFALDEYMPPYQNAAYHVHFYYTPYRTPQDFWKSEGGYWSTDSNKFMGVGLMSSGSNYVHDAAVAATAGATADEEKARKLYTLTGTLENTDFSRERTKAENKSEGVKEIKSVDDVLRLKRGSSDQIAMLYVALARAVGLNASLMVVSDRKYQTLNANWLDFYRQLSDDIAIVNYGGADHFLDPGSPFCAFGHLQWNHSMSAGVRQQGKETAMVPTPAEGYKASRTARVADLKLDDEGHMSGTVTLTYTGSPAAEWRQMALRTDESEVKEKMSKRLEEMLPGGTEAKVVNISGLTGDDAPLKVTYGVTGNLGSAAGSRVVLPSDVFVSTQAPVFPHAHREQAVYFHYPEVVQDAVRVVYPATFAIESVPVDQKLQYKQGAAYAVRSKVTGNSVTVWRDLTVAEFYYPVEDFPELRKFYGDFEHVDHGAIVLKRTSASAGSPTAPSGE